ncbi:MAG: branched-chain amino acid ABC transporter permease [Anaerolineae bacterium]
MATQLPTSSPTARTIDMRALRPVIIGVVIIAAATALLLFINRGMIYFPLWSAIGFPALVITPFAMMGLKIPNNLKAFILVITLLLILPYLGIQDSFYLELATQIGIFAAMALGLNIVVGFAGLLDLGYIAFFAVGAYLWGVFTSAADIVTKQNGIQAAPETFWLFLIFGVIAAAAMGILLGLPVLRLKGDYLAIVTLGFGEVIRILVSNLSNISPDPTVKVNITNGAQGLFGIQDPPLPDFFIRAVAGVAPNAGNPTALAYQFFFYFLVIAICGLAIIIAARLENSPIGRAWTAIREDETAAIAMGVPLVRMKLMAFAIGASFAGAMGVIYAAKQTFVSPESFSFNQSIFILAIVIVGGMGSIRGVILGATVVTLLNLQVLKNFSILIGSLKSNLDQVPVFLQGIIASWPVQLEPARYERLVFGLLLALMMIFRPAGILPATRRKLELQAKKQSEVVIDGGD